MNSFIIFVILLKKKMRGQFAYTLGYMHVKYRKNVNRQKCVNVFNLSLRIYIYITVTVAQNVESNLIKIHISERYM